MANNNLKRTNFEKRNELLQKASDYDMFTPEWNKLMDEVDRIRDLHQDAAQYHGEYKNIDTGFKSADYSLQPDNDLANKFLEDHIDNYPDVNKNIEKAKADATKSLTEAMNTPYDESGITQYDLVAMNIEGIADATTVTDPADKNAQKLASELDDDLVILHGAGQGKYDKLIKYGVDTLNDFDKFGEAHGIKAPDRKINKTLALESQNKAKQSSFEFKEINNVPEPENDVDSFDFGK